MAFATVFEWIGFIFFKGPKNKGENNLKKNIPIFSPNLFSFLSPNKKDGLIIPILGKLSLFNSSSTSPLNFK